MFGSRGARSSTRPSEKCAGLAPSLNLHSAGLARICGLLAFSAIAGWAHAGYTVTGFPEDICATESIYLDGFNPNVQGVTDSGITYTVQQSEAYRSYSGRYIGVDSRHSTVTIRFDKPMAAVGAMLTVSGYGSFAVSQDEEDSGLLVTESGYRGVVASPGSIREVTFATNNGPIAALRIDIRPLPIAVNDKIQVFQNSHKIYDSGTLLKNDLHAETASLFEAPQHAEIFQLREDGSFLYQPAKNYQGKDSFSYRAANGLASSVSEPATVEIDVLPVNCAPEFVVGANVRCNEGDDLQTLQNWATSMSAGSETDGPQGLFWEITTDRPDLFSLAPALDLNGTLSFQPAPLQSGIANVTVCLRDDGGMANGGVDSSAPQTFTITILDRVHAPLLEPIMDCAVRAGDALILAARVLQIDPGTEITYSLQDAPDGASIDTRTGQIIWRPGRSMAGQMPEFVVRANSVGDDSLSSTTHFRVEVLEEPQGPKILPILDLIAEPGLRVSTRVVGQGSDNMRYFLASDVPGAMLNPTTGEFHWTAKEADVGRKLTFAVTAVDLDNPRLCSMKTFAILVRNSTIAMRKKTTSDVLIAKTRGLESTGRAAMRFTGKPRKK